MSPGTANQYVVPYKAEAKDDKPPEPRFAAPKRKTSPTDVVRAISKLTTTAKPSTRAPFSGVFRRTKVSAADGFHVSSIDGVGMLETFSEYRRLGAAILWAASRDEAMWWSISLILAGEIRERTAHFFIEPVERMLLGGLSNETRFECPLTQKVLADALSLTAIHINRV